MYTELFNLQDVEKAIRHADLNSLVIFDVDDVLMHPNDEALKIYNTEKFSNIFSPLKKGLTEKQAWKLESIILAESKYEPVCKGSSQFVRSLQDKGIRVLALTQLFTGTFGVVESLEDWRIAGLQDLDLNFGESWEELSDKIFTNIPSIQHPEFYPLYKKGVVFTCDRSKGEILGEFLSFSKISPDNIVMFDDKIKHLKSVA